MLTSHYAVLVEDILFVENLCDNTYALFNGHVMGVAKLYLAPPPKSRTSSHKSSLFYEMDTAKDLTHVQDDTYL